MFWAMFCWESLDPCIQVDGILTCTTPKIVAKQVHPFIVTVLPDSSFSFQHHNAPCHSKTFGQKWFDKQDKDFKVLPPNSRDLRPVKYL